MKSYDTVTEALADLKSRGFDSDFNLQFDALNCTTNNICLKPEDFEVTEFYRFEGATDPSDEDIVYAIKSKDGTVKGTLTSAFGVYADNVSDVMLKKLSMHTSP